ncbi:hypothetical protein WA026_017065 [Henosepilachna vigintioctopunctata]|uniref:DUF4746 domain-containing protein n=1 Tax=Henosepilachna vigintioctopunctata TaxID=420089 RepID=A0AAW1TYS0_9CUCU
MNLQVTLTRDIMEEIMYFSDMRVEDFNFEENPKKPIMGLTLKRSSENLPRDVIDDIVLQVVYGNSRRHPGDENSPSQRFLRTDPDGRKFIGLWAPPNTRCKALALKLLFPSLSKAYKLPEVKHIPLHVAMAFDAFKTNDLMKLHKEYPSAIIRYGFFDSDQPTEARLIAKTMEDFDARLMPTTYEEKIIFQISKEHEECFKLFMEQCPSYRSADVEIGEQDCRILFPPGYDAPPKEENVIIKKSKRKKAKIIHQVTVNQDGEEVIETMVTDKITTESAEEDKREDKEDDGEENDNEEEEEYEEDDEDDLNVDEAEEINIEAEKATSPMQEV